MFDALIALLGAEDVIYIQNIVVVVVILAIVMDRFGGLGEDPARVARGLILERRITPGICRDNMQRERMQWLRRVSN